MLGFSVCFKLTVGVAIAINLGLAEIMREYVGLSLGLLLTVGESVSVWLGPKLTLGNAVGVTLGLDVIAGDCAVSECVCLLPGLLLTVGEFGFQANGRRCSRHRTWHR